MTRTTRILGLAAVCSLGLTGCELIDDVIAEVLDINNLSLLGVIPDANFANPSSKKHGRVTMALGATDDKDNPIRPSPTDLVIEDEDGTEIPIEEGEEIPGHDTGSFVLLVDGSASLEQSGPGCEGCPTDAARMRVEAAQILAESLHSCGPDWRQSLMEFSTDDRSNGFDYTRVLADYTENYKDVWMAADSLGSEGGTPLWDATSEVLASLVDDTVEQYDANPDIEPHEYGAGIVVISDGADTGSAVSLTKLIEQAVAEGIPVHTIGLGPASDSYDDYSSNTAAIEDLRRLAAETGGYYGYVADAKELPELAKSIADATCGGYTEIYADFPEPKTSGERQWGSVRLKGTPLKVPFTFTVP